MSGQAIIVAATSKKRMRPPSSSAYEPEKELQPPKPWNRPPSACRSRYGDFAPAAAATGAPDSSTSRQVVPVRGAGPRVLRARGRDAQRGS